jgi:predicted glycogen debranching enzyme
MIDPEECEEREWLIPTGTGGYASSTICGINSRTYHGYLIVPQDPPHKRYMILSKFEDFLVYNGKEYPLSTNRYNFNVYYPNGYRYLNKAILGENFISWNYSFDNLNVIKTLIVNKGCDSISISYSSDNGIFRICPLITFRSHHVALKTRPGFFDFRTNNNTIEIRLNEKPILYFGLNGDFSLEQTEYWYYNFFYNLDYERGSNYLEDLYNPFCIVSKSNKIEINAYVLYPRKYSIMHLNRDIIRLLSTSSKDFVVKGKDWAIIAGYHWFDEWGRDTFVSMEGLLLLNGEYEIAKSIIKRYLDFEEKGLLPNGFLHNGEPIYKGVDVSLWAINAIYSFYRYSKDKAFIMKIFPKILDIIDWYWKGNGIISNNNGIIFHIGSPRTWMDAQFDGTVVTPREGAAVEVNALWYNALMIVSKLSKELGLDNTEFIEKAKVVKSAFKENFVGENGLYDYIDLNMRPSKEIRPNQIFAISLPFPVIDNEELANKILSIVENELLRPYGLSTLSRKDPLYIPFYRGDRISRDRAYHNGPIWPWLIGAYTDAKIRLEKNIIKIKNLLNEIKPLLDIAEKNNGYIQELFEDIPPYKSGGCIAQAWSVAEVYRSLNKIITFS